jgi:hypothetical protein
LRFVRLATLALLSVLACSSSSTPAQDSGTPVSDAASEAAADSGTPSCDAPFQNLVFSSPSGVTGGAFSSAPKGENSGGQPFLSVSDGPGRSFDVEFFDTMALPAQGKTFDYATQGQPGGVDTAWGTYMEGQAILTPVSGKVTVICSKGRFLAVTLTNAVFKGIALDGGPSGESITVNGSIGATIP